MTIPQQLPRNDFRFGFIGALIPPKGLAFLLEAFRRVARKSSHPLSLHIYGPELPYRASRAHLTDYRRMARSLPVTFHGPVTRDALPGVFADMDALVMPSVWWETHGRVIREAWQARVPVIASELGAMAEAIIHERTGLLAWPGDPQELSECMLRLVNDRSLYDTLRNNSPSVKTLATDIDEHIALYDAVRTGCPLPGPALNSESGTGLHESSKAEEESARI